MRRKVTFIADAGEVARSVGVSVLAIALAVYAMVMQERKVIVVVLGATVLVVAAGGLLQVSRAVHELRRRHQQAHQAAARAERHYVKVLRRLIATIEAREQYTRGRSARIGHLARWMGGQLGLDHRLCGLLSLAAQVHDIGLLAVPEEILNRPSRLGNDEFRTIRKHPEMSFRILQPLTFMTEVLPAVRYHHERMNGTGYPHGLAGQEIPLSARILAVADAYDAMTHDRPHRPALAAIEALRELRRCTPAGYDERCVAALEAIMHLERLEEAHAAAEGTHPALSSGACAPTPSVLGAAGL